MTAARSKTVVVTMDNHMSGMGTSLIYRVEGEEHGAFNGVPLPDCLDWARGQRYRVTFERLDPDPELKPRRNPWRKCEHSPKCKRGVYPSEDTCGTREECRRERKAAQVEQTLSEESNGQAVA